MANKRRVNRLSPERRRADIMMSAREVFSEKGFNEAVMSDIADRAGVVEGSIYRYFKNKRDLLFCVSEAWFEEMISADEQTLAAVTGTWNRLRFIIHRHLVAIKTNPDLSRLVFQHLRPDPDYRNTNLFALNKAYTNRVVEVVREGMEKREIRADISPSLVRDMVFGAIEHRTWAYLRDEGGYDPDILADQMTDLAAFGLKRKDQTDEIARAIEMLEGAIDRLQPGHREA